MCQNTYIVCFLSFFWFPYGNRSMNLSEILYEARAFIAHNIVSKLCVKIHILCVFGFFLISSGIMIFDICKMLLGNFWGCIIMWIFLLCTNFHNSDPVQRTVAPARYFLSCSKLPKILIQNTDPVRRTGTPASKI